MIEGNGPAALYLRISSDPKLLALGVARQEFECRKLAADLGWEVGRVYEDNDLSAHDRKVVRPAYEELLRDMKAGRVSRLIVWMPDRLYRRMADLLALIDAIEAGGVAIKTVRAGDIDLSTPTGRTTAKIVGAIAEGEVEKVGERMAAKRAELTRDGKFGGGPRPFGTGRPDEVALLIGAKDRILRGDTLRAIGTDWHAHGVRGTRGNVISPTSLRKMLLSPKWRETFGENDWQQVGVILRNPSRATARPSRFYLLPAGLLRCGVCGGPMYGRPSMTGRPVPMYGCKPGVGATKCGKVHIRVADANAAAMTAVLGYLYSPEFETRQAQLQAESPDLNGAVLALAKVEERQSELAALAGSGELSPTAYAKVIRPLEVEAQAARKAVEAAQMATLQTRETMDVATVLGHWEGLSATQQQRVLLTVVESITVRPHHGSVVRKDPDRVTVTFK